MNSGDEADEIQQALLHRLLGVLGDLRVRRQDQRWDRQSARPEMGSTIGNRQDLRVLHDLAKVTSTEDRRFVAAAKIQP
jgi:hypothetical protein